MKRIKPNPLAESIMLALNTPPRVYAISCALAAKERQDEAAARRAR